MLKRSILLFVLLLLVSCGKEISKSMDPFADGDTIYPIFFASSLGYHELGQDMTWGADNNFNLQIVNIRQAIFTLRVPFQRSGFLTLEEPPKGQTCGKRLRHLTIGGFASGESMGKYRLDLEYGKRLRFEYQAGLTYIVNTSFENYDSAQWAACVNFNVTWEPDSEK